MSRKRLTQRFPFLLPIRAAQRKLFFYSVMHFDGHRYAKTLMQERYHHKAFAAYSPLYNRNTGSDMVYQENKVFNLKLASKCLNGLLIQPGETFSFWQAVRHANKKTPYKDGLVVINGTLATASGGGLCQMSNLLFWMFLHSPLTIIERHGHKKMEFPSPEKDLPVGVDATVSEGWLDVKVKNETDHSFQIDLSFDDQTLTGTLLTEKEFPWSYQIRNEDLIYFRQEETIFEKASVYRKTLDCKVGQIQSDLFLYENVCEIAYPLPSEIVVSMKGVL